MPIMIPPPVSLVCHQPLPLLVGATEGAMLSPVEGVIFVVYQTFFWNLPWLLGSQMNCVARATLPFIPATCIGSEKLLCLRQLSKSGGRARAHERCATFTAGPFYA